MSADGATTTSNTVGRDVCSRAEAKLASTADIGALLTGRLGAVNSRWASRLGFLKAELEPPAGVDVI